MYVCGCVFCVHYAVAFNSYISSHIYNSLDFLFEYQTVFKHSERNLLFSASISSLFQNVILHLCLCFKTLVFK